MKHPNQYDSDVDYMRDGLTKTEKKALDIIENGDLTDEDWEAIIEEHRESIEGFLTDRGDVWEYVMKMLKSREEF